MEHLRPLSAPWLVYPARCQIWIWSGRPSAPTPAITSCLGIEWGNLRDNMGLAPVRYYNVMGRYTPEGRSASTETIWTHFRKQIHLSTCWPLPFGACADSINPVEFRGSYSATSNNMKLVHWPLMGSLLHLVQRGGDWAGPQPVQSPPRCAKCNRPPINGQCTNHRIAV